MSELFTQRVKYVNSRILLHDMTVPAPVVFKVKIGVFVCYKRNMCVTVKFYFQLHWAEGGKIKHGKYIKTGSAYYKDGVEGIKSWPHVDFALENELMLIILEVPPFYFNVFQYFY